MSTRQSLTCFYKAGNPHSFVNYTAISILVAFSKILEKIATVQLTEYFVNNCLFTSCQYGCRKGVSTADAALQVATTRACECNYCIMCWWYTPLHFSPCPMGHEELKHRQYQYKSTKDFGQ